MTVLELFASLTCPSGFTIPWLQLGFITPSLRTPVQVRGHCYGNELLAGVSSFVPLNLRKGQGSSFLAWRMHPESSPALPLHRQCTLYSARVRWQGTRIHGNLHLLVKDAMQNTLILCIEKIQQMKPQWTGKQKKRRKAAFLLTMLFSGASKLHCADTKPQLASWLLSMDLKPS